MAHDPLENLVDSDANTLTGDFRTLMTALKLLEADPASGSLKEKEIIQATATRLSKAWTVLTGAAGGVLSFASILAAWKAAEQTTKLALIGGASLTLGATVLAIAVIVRSDLAARASVTNALFRARATVTDAVVVASRAAE